MTTLMTSAWRAPAKLAAIALAASFAALGPASSQQYAPGRAPQPGQPLRPAQPAKPVPPKPEDSYRQVMNGNTVTVLGASLSGAYIKIVEDIAKAVNDGDKLRVLPIVGDGGSQNIKDLLYLRGVDAGIVMSTSMDSFKGKPLYGNLPARLQYIARLYEEEFHIVGGPAIASVEDLAGKTVGFHGGAFASGQDLLAKLKIKPAQALQVDFFKGLDQVKTGEIAAIVRATASPMQDLDGKFDPVAHRMVPIPFPDSLIESYLPGQLTHKAYPRAVAQGRDVPTVAIGVVLATPAWQPGTERYRRVARFTEAFFGNIEKLMADKNRHPKWDDVNLAATLPGWQRFPAAEEWLKGKGYPVTATASTTSGPAALSGPLQKPRADAAEIKAKPPQPLPRAQPALAGPRPAQ